MRASLTLGFQRFGDFWRAGPRSWIHRFGLGLSAMAYLENQSANLHLAGSYKHLDGSEKAAMSYWQGMIFAKLMAEHKLSIVWFAHVDDMRSKGVLTTTATTKERGDFAGKTSVGDWHVVEAKGRSNQMEKGLIRKAKRQAALVKSIDGKKPHTHSACVSCLWKTPIEIILDDPKPVPGDANEQWVIGEEAFWNYYYGSLANYINEFALRSPGESNSDYVFAPLLPFFINTSFDDPIPYWFDRRIELLRIGLPKRIVESPGTAPEVLLQLPPDSSGYRANDGVALAGRITDWNTL